MKQLDERKLKILQCVVDRFIDTGEPVGSKLIAEEFEQAVSSATVRNDMALLEKMGYLEQPHTSAGRIPTPLGYRFYISHLMQREPLSEDDRENIDQMIAGGDLNPKTLISNATDLLGELTGCAIISLTEKMNFSIITRVDVIPAGYRLYAVLLITSGGTVENRVCRLEFDLTQEQITFFVRFIRENLMGMRVDELTHERLVELGLALGAYTVALAPLLYGVYDITSKLQKRRFEIKNEASLLKQWEFQSGSLTYLIEQQEQLTGILERAFNGINIIFGDSGEEFAMTNSTMIVSPYSQGGRTIGSFGVIGPIRLDYRRIIPYIEYLSDTVSRLMTEGLEEDRSKPSRSRQPTQVQPYTPKNEEDRKD